MTYDTKWGATISVNVLAHDLSPGKIRFIARMLNKDRDPRNSDAHALHDLIQKLEPVCHPDHAKSGIEWLRTNLFKKGGDVRNTPAGKVLLRLRERHQRDVINPRILNRVDSVALVGFDDVVETYTGNSPYMHLPQYEARVSGEPRFWFTVRPWQSGAGLWLGAV